MKIKCTFDECTAHFNSDKAMIKHKKEYPDHIYCARCDLDCSDDLDLFIHQIMSNKHVACPVCGEEFKSAGGRDRHVELSHPSKQKNLHCPACATRFEFASALMHHVERGECRAIGEGAFVRHRTEKKLQQEAWAETLEPGHKFTIATYTDAGSETQGGVWIQNSIGHSQTGSFRNNSTTVPRGTSITAANTNKIETNTLAETNDADDEPDFIEEHRRRLAELKISTNTPWSGTELSSGHLFPDAECSYISGSCGDGNKLDEIGSFPEFADEDWPHFNNTSFIPHQPSNNENSITGTANPDPNAIHAHIQTVHSNHLGAHTGRPNTSVDANRYLNPLTGMYECPSLRCQGKYKTETTFIRHLADDEAHPVEVRCPRCLKVFRSTTAFVMHAESGSRRCRIRYSTDYDKILKEMTGGLLGVNGTMEDGGIKYESRPVEFW